MENTGKTHAEEVVAHTRRLLLNRPISLSTKTISANIGLTTGWINTFGRGEISNPGIISVMSLQSFLIDQINETLQNAR